MKGTFAIAVVWALTLPVLPSHAQPVFDADHVGGPNSAKHAELFMPESNAPVPAVVVLHGCNGVSKHYRDWAQLLRSWGYAALMVDSFGPRGHSNVCGRGNLVPPSERLKDALRAADYLRSLPTIRKDAIGLIGFSHGGWTVLNTVLQQKVAAAGGTPFAAAVAYYPACLYAGSPLVTDTLILIGADDDWTPAADCQRWHDKVPRNGHALKLKVYPDTLHGFDSKLPAHLYFGHLLGRNDAAAADAEALTRAFLARRLMAR